MRIELQEVLSFFVWILVVNMHGANRILPRVSSIQQKSKMKDVTTRVVFAQRDGMMYHSGVVGFLDFLTLSRKLPQDVDYKDLIS
jgi:hypothetical protein